MSFSIIFADYQNPQHGHDLVYLLDHYAHDPMGGGEPLSSYVRSHLVEKLQAVPGAFSLLCYQQQEAVGLVNCFMGFSTFKCRPLVNIHDVVVHADYRGQGISRQLLTVVEQVARQRNCCKLTLEVLEGNEIARKAYRRFGFAGYELDPKAGTAQMWQKPLD
ncbi:GNAT family N-acetyltransferase [Gynuella sp.]|uniref:GNAT family N-acetyltransferase n=1 Tax=Gynuella sp. TaxID=2969146 RepID=UPI003D0AFB50